MLCSALVFAVFAFCLPQGEAIKCFSCSSLTNPKCGDPIETTEQLECTPDVFREAGSFINSASDAISGLMGKAGIDVSLPTVDANSAFICMKVVRQDGDKKLVVRSCTIPNSDKYNACNKVKEQFGTAVTFCETCDKDGCNGSTTAVPSSLLLFLLASVAAYLAKN